MTLPCPGSLVWLVPAEDLVPGLTVSPPGRQRSGLSLPLIRTLMPGAHPQGLMSADRVCRALCPGEPTVTVQGMRTTAHLCREHNPTRTKHLCEPRLQRDYLLRSGETSRQPCISHLLLCDKGAPCPVSRSVAFTALTEADLEAPGTAAGGPWAASPKGH